MFHNRLLFNNNDKTTTTVEADGKALAERQEGWLTTGGIRPQGAATRQAAHTEGRDRV